MNMTNTRGTWTKSDLLMSSRFNKLRAQQGMKSLQELSKESGIKYSRLRDILQHRHGKPMLSEFLILCQVFSVSPENEIRAIQQDARAGSPAPDNFASRKTGPTPLQQRSLDKRDIHEIATLLSRAQAIASRNLKSTASEEHSHKQQWVLMANRDPNRDIEADTPDD